MTFRGLPMFLTLRNRNWIGLSVFLSAIFTYMPANHWPILEPRELPMSWLDQWVPFLPNTVWIYMSEWLLFGVLYYFARDLRNLNRYLYAFLTLQTLSVAIFWIWPTTYPRHLFPLPDDLNALTYYSFSNLRAIDSPNSCCPSLHVSSVYLSSFLYIDERRRIFPFALLWATLVAASTLTTKQHYIIDLVAGLMMAVICYWIFFRYLAMRPADDAGAQAKR